VINTVDTSAMFSRKNIVDNAMSLTVDRRLHKG
jgi:hypothetical protein